MLNLASHSKTKAVHILKLTISIRLRLNGQLRWRTLNDTIENDRLYTTDPPGGSTGHQPCRSITINAHTEQSSLELAMAWKQGNDSSLLEYTWRLNSARRPRCCRSKWNSSVTAACSLDCGDATQSHETRRPHRDPGGRGKKKINSAYSQKSNTPRPPE